MNYLFDIMNIKIKKYNIILRVKNYNMKILLK